VSLGRAFLNINQYLSFSLDGNDPEDAIIYPIPLRGQQLGFRCQEVYTAYSTFCRFLRDDPTLEIDTLDSSPYAVHSWTTSGDSKTKVRVDEKITLAGHSFGGCTVVCIFLVLWNFK